MINIDNNFKKIINPPKDFMFGDDLVKNQKYLNLVYDRIFSEIFKFLENKKNTKIRSCKRHVGAGLIDLKTKDYEYKINFIFDKNFVEVMVNGKKIGVSEIHGAEINKETLSVSKVKVDLISIKKEIGEFIN